MIPPRFLPLAVALGATALPARADVYYFTDERGVVHVTNQPELDRRYKPVPPEGLSALAPRPAGATASREGARYADVVDAAARAHGVDAALVHAVITAESGYDPNAVSRKGASGLMQLMPATARRYGVRDVFDPRENVQGGVRYLKDLLAMFDGDLRLALAGYNAGENAVIRAGRRIPPYAETQGYVPRVIDFYHRYRARAG